MDGVDMACIEQLVIHGDEHAQSILQLIFVYYTVPRGCAERDTKDKQNCIYVLKGN